MTVTPSDLGPVPSRVETAERIARDNDYELSSSRETGSLLRVLAASKPGGRILELGTGVGVGAGWILDGMTPDATLDTVEIHPEACDFARDVLDDDRVTVHQADTRDWVREHAADRYDLIFADAGAPKFWERDLTTAMLAPGGIFLADDLLPQEKWVAAHPELVGTFRSTIHDEPDLVTVLVDWASGLSISVRR